jgi:hypothetical protein
MPLPLDLRSAGVRSAHAARIVSVPLCFFANSRELFLNFICNPVAEKSGEQNRNWNSEKPKQNVPSRPSLFDSIG